MRIPTIQGVIDRRILANYRIEPECMAAVLPSPFRPMIINGFAVGGICLIRLKKLRPQFLPFGWGLSSENAAHRVAVEWNEDGKTRCGVYIPRRDTSSRLSAIAGGTVFPGIHHLAKFDILENQDYFSVSMQSRDGLANVHVGGRISVEFPAKSIFDNLQQASNFFERGSVGFSDTNVPGRFDGLELRCKDWQVRALHVGEIRSSYFEDSTNFPFGSVTFDCALLMQNIQHQWHGLPDLRC